jgi:hypothetical protein
MDFVIGDEQSQPAMMERDIVPAGVHQMVIKHVEEGPNQYKSCDENPDGQCLKLRLATSSGNHKFVFDDIPKHLGWRAKQLAEAIGVNAGGTKLSLATSDLDGLEVTVEVRRGMCPEQLLLRQRWRSPGRRPRKRWLCLAAKTSRFSTRRPRDRHDAASTRRGGMNAMECGDGRL